MENITAMRFNKDEFIVDKGPFSYSKMCPNSVYVDKKGKKVSWVEMVGPSLIRIRETNERYCPKEIEEENKIRGFADFEGNSLLDLDLKARWSRQTKESRKAIKLGKKLGI
ncbi:hypothetical protein V6N13_059073 [Hibiscus sabdariffa]